MQYKVISNKPESLEKVTDKLFNDGWIPLREYAIEGMNTTTTYFIPHLIMILQKPDEEDKK